MEKGHSEIGFAAAPALTRSRDQFRNRTSILHDVYRTSVEVVERDPAVVDAEVVVNRSKEVAGVAWALDHVFTAFVAGTDDAASLDAAASPNIGEGTRPVIAAGL